MEKKDTFEQFLVTQAANVSKQEFIVNLLLVGILAFALRYVYVKYSRSHNNRMTFSSLFPLLAITTMIIISIVKSSLALSLGLVGALSIVRFRTAVKESEELIFLFFNIALGLGLGANQRFLVGVGFVFFVGFFLIRHFFDQRANGDQLYVRLSKEGVESSFLDSILKELRKSVSFASIKRIEKIGNTTEASLLVSFSNVNEIQGFVSYMNEKHPEINFSCIDHNESLS